MRRGRLALVMTVVVAAAALLVVASPPEPARAATSINVCPTPTHGVPGSGYSWVMKSAGCAGTLINCTTPASVTWDNPGVTTNGFSATVPGTAAVGAHTLRGSCTVCGAACSTVAGSGGFTVEPPPTTTTTTTTTVPATTVPPTVPATTAPRVTTTTRPVTTTSTTTTTVPDTSVTTVVPESSSSTTVTIAGGKGVRLDRAASPPGGDANANGEGCDSGVPVTLSIGDDTVGHAMSDANGKFAAPLVLPDLPVGRYTLTAKCGPTLNTDIDIVLASALGPPSGTLSVLVFFLLIGFALVRRQISADLQRRG